MLGAKKVKSQKVPVIFDPTMAAGFVASIAGAANGDAVFKKSSFLASKLGKDASRPDTSPSSTTACSKKASARLPSTVKACPRGARHCREGRAEGVPLRHVHRAQGEDADHRQRVTRLPFDAAHRHAQPVSRAGHAAARRDSSSEVPNGFYVTAMLGHGANMVTGEYSRGANGLWIENGELTHPVQEVTVAGHLLDMLAASTPSATT